MELMVIRSLRILACFLLLGCACLGQTATTKSDKFVKFQVMSVRTMSSEESHRKLSDVVGVDLSVSLRLSNLSQRTIYFYAETKSMIPFGRLVKKTNDGVVWLGGRERESKISPGIDPVLSGTWVMLPEGAAIEWEEFDATTPSDETHAKTLFIKVGEEGSVTEVFSDFYKVPARTLKSSARK